MNIREIIAWFENKRKTLLKSLSYGQKISMLLGLRGVKRDVKSEKMSFD